MPELPHRSWPRAQDYRYLETVRRADLAWEWLRRAPAFRRVAPSTCHKAANGITVIDAAPAGIEARWGCLHVPDPGLGAIDAPILWSVAVDPSVLRVTAVPAGRRGAPAFDIRRYGALTMLVVRAQDRQQLLLRGDGQDIRLDVVAGSLLDGPVTLRLELLDLGKIDPALAAMRRLFHLHRTGRFPAVTPSADRCTRRLVQSLRVHDALAQGASIRDVGVMLFGADRIRAEWLAPGEALKSQCRRLIALSRAMVAGGYKTLLS